MSSPGADGMPNPSRARNLGPLKSACLAGLLLVVLVGAYVLRYPRSGAAQTVGDFAILLTVLSAAVSCGVAARRADVDRRAWAMLSVAAGVWGLGQIAWTAFGLADGHVYPFPSVADAGFVGYGLPAVAALLLFRRARVRGSAVLRPVLDAVVIALAILFVSWQTVFRAASATHDVTGLTELTTLAYPTVDVLVASVVLALGMRRPPGERLRWVVLGGGLVALTVTDSTYVSWVSAGQTGLTGSLLTTGWMTAWLLVAVAPWVAGGCGEAVERRGDAVVVELVPYVPVLVAVAVLALVPLHGAGLGLAIGLLLLVGVAARQVMIVRENVVLTHDLEDQVARRTSELAGLASIVRSSKDAIVATSVDGVIQSWNPGAEQLFGYTPEHAVGRSVRAMGANEDERARLSAVLQRVAHGEKVDGDESKWQCGDGSVVPVAFSFSPIREGGVVTGISAIGQDITERRAAQQELEKARGEALESSRLKSDFLATMSHEIRTPMNGVIGLNELLLGTTLDARQRELALGVQSAGRSLLTIIDSILDFSKIEAGKLELESADFDVRTVFEQVATLLAEPAAKRGIELVVACRPDVPERLRGDAGRLGQILANLGSNAVKFTHEGEVAIQAHLQDATDTDVVLRVEVKDTGVGIAPEAIGRLFDAFTQEDASTTRRFGGTGLGLAITSQLVAAMDGQIGVRSHPGQGSSFWFTVRLLRAATVSPTPTRPVQPIQGRRALVVDDNATNRLILGEQLSAWRLRSTPVDSAEAALVEIAEAAQAGDPYDIVLLDMCMPGMDGQQLAQAIRAEPRDRPLALVLLTSSYSLNEGDLRSSGIDACLRKPVRSSELYDTLVGLTFDRAGDEPDAGAEAAASSPPSAAGTPPAGSKGRVLVVEDNEINQMVAVGILEQMGYSVEVANDGEQALEAFSVNGYAAVLMDCQMPVMDGWDATLAIRSVEDGQARVPIIALTASATERERQRCLDAGMDDFLTKPLDPKALDAALQHWVERSEAPADQTPEPPTLDHARLEMFRELQPEDNAMLDRVVASFLTRSPQTFTQITEAISAGSAEDLAHTAHALKGSALNLGAPGVAAVCGALEDIAYSGDLDLAPPLVGRLSHELDRAQAALRTLQNG